MPGLNSSPGLETWTPASKQGEFYSSFDLCPPKVQVHSCLLCTWSHSTTREDRALIPNSRPADVLYLNRINGHSHGSDWSSPSSDYWLNKQQQLTLVRLSPPGSMRGFKEGWPSLCSGDTGGAVSCWRSGRSRSWEQPWSGSQGRLKLSRPNICSRG